MRDWPSGEVGDVDHLLHLAQAFGEDLAVLERDQRAQIVLVAAQLLAELADRLAALGCGYLAPRLAAVTAAAMTDS